MTATMTKKHHTHFSVKVCRSAGCDITRFSMEGNVAIKTKLWQLLETC
jgi:hypothetical protein